MSTISNQPTLKDHMTSISIYVPYFYIIQHNESKKFYAGCRFAKNCNPSEFWQPGGYFTSSPTVKRIISSEGIEAFSIVKIKTFTTGDDAFNYETRFLHKVKAATNPNFINGHENRALSYGTTEFKEMMMKLHGVENPSSLDWVKEKKVETFLKNYGVKNMWEVEELRQNHINAIREKYNDPTITNCSQAQEVKDKKAHTHLKNYGVEHAWQSEELRLKHIQMMRENYNDPTITNCSQLQAVKDKKQESALREYGVTNVFKSEVIKDKIKQVNLTKYGVEHASQCQFVKDKVNLNKKHKAARIQVSIIKQYVAEFKLSLGRGWYQRDTEALNGMIDELERKHGYLSTDSSTIKLNF